MTEKQARYFMEVYKEKNIALAADRLFVSRPVVSRAISELEREFSSQLFTRSNSGVEPTDAGTMLFRLITEMIVNYNAVASGIKSLKDTGINRELRFGVTPTNAYKIYNELLRGFLEVFPDIRLKIIECPSRESIEILLNGEADIVFTPQGISESYLETIDGYQAQFSLGVSNKHPLSSKDVVSINDIYDLTFGILCAPMPLEDVFNSYFSSFGKQPNIAVRTTNFELLKKITQDGRIAVVLPGDMMIDWENVAVVPLDFFNASTHRLVWNNLIAHNSAFDDLVGYAKKVFSGKQKINKKTKEERT